jgi:DNA invertase Pin-like site-specific DNA recombinase
MCERFIGLVRVSTERQGESRLGLEAGHADLKGYVAQQGAELITTLEEVESGTHDDLIDRPTLLKALTLCKRHKACLLIPKVDRLVRSTCVHTDIKRSGVSFRAVDNPTANEFTLDILVAVAANEARAISDRTKKALAAYKARGGVLGSHLVGCHLTAEDRAKGRAKGNAKSAREAVEVYDDLIPEMKAWKAEGATFQAIADKLNARGDQTRTGAEWSNVQVIRTLKRAEVQA